MKIILTIAVVALMRLVALGQTDSSSVLNNYLKVKNALIKSDGTEAAKFAVELKKSVQAETDFKDREVMLEATRIISDETEIERQREAFTVVSVLVWNHIEASKLVAQDVYYDYCPMKDAYWISEEAEIKNPYYGSKMLNCGTVRESKIIKK